MRKLIPPHKRAVELTFEIFRKWKRDSICCLSDDKYDTIIKVRKSKCLGGRNTYGRKKD